METTKLLKTDFLDILFDDRNKDYGAYDLRRKYDKRVRNAVISMAAVVTAIIGGYTISTRLMASDHEPFVVKDYVPLPAMEKIEVPVEPPVIPPPAAHTPPPAAAPAIDHAIFKIAKDDDVRPEDEVPKNADLGEKAIGVANIDGDPNGVDFGVPEGTSGTGVVKVPEVEKRSEPFITVEIMPEFPGGEAALRKFLSNNTRYPSMAQDNGVSGIVFVRFVVDKTGQITNVETVGAKKGAGLEEEALRVVRKMPKWKPGRQNGENVPVYFNLPINFKMQE